MFKRCAFIGACALSIAIACLLYRTFLGPGYGTKNEQAANIAPAVDSSGPKDGSGSIQVHDLVEEGFSKEHLLLICYALTTGEYRTLERCRRDSAEVMMRRAAIVQAFYATVCSPAQLDDIIRQSQGHKYNYTLQTSVQGKMWQYFVETYDISSGSACDWVGNVDYVGMPGDILPENITEIRFHGERLKDKDKRNYLYSMEVYTTDMSPQEVERSVFNKDGEMLAYSRFDRGVSQYVILLDHGKIKDSFCVTF